MEKLTDERKREIYGSMLSLVINGVSALDAIEQPDEKRSGNIHIEKNEGIETFSISTTSSIRENPNHIDETFKITFKEKGFHGIDESLLAETTYYGKNCNVSVTVTSTDYFKVYRTGDIVTFEYYWTGEKNKVPDWENTTRLIIKASSKEDSLLADLYFANNDGTLKKENTTPISFENSMKEAEWIKRCLVHSLEQYETYFQGIVTTIQTIFPEWEIIKRKILGEEPTRELDERPPVK